jgi:ribonuclease BN (tRNA processing enzyme)
MSIRVTVLGCSGGYANPDKACSGYLLRDGHNSLALDLGAGAFSNLLRYMPAGELGGLAITHMHYDHYVDIYGLCTARRFWLEDLPPLPLLAPPGALVVMTSSLEDNTRNAFARSLDVLDVRVGNVEELSGFEVIAYPAEHGVGSFIYRLSVDGKTICYSGDTDLCDALLEQARGADLFICECTFTSEVREKMRGHLFAAEAGKAAAQAGVGTLLLTHLWPTLSQERAIGDARSTFDGDIRLAVEGMTIEL